MYNFLPPPTNFFWSAQNALKTSPFEKLEIFTSKLYIIFFLNSEKKYFFALQKNIFQILMEILDLSEDFPIITVRPQSSHSLYKEILTKTQHFQHEKIFFWSAKKYYFFRSWEKMLGIVSMQKSLIFRIMRFSAHSEHSNPSPRASE